MGIQDNGELEFQLGIMCIAFMLWVVGFALYTLIAVVFEIDPMITRGVITGMRGVVQRVIEILLKKGMLQFKGGKTMNCIIDITMTIVRWLLGGFIVAIIGGTIYRRTMRTFTPTFEKKYGMSIFKCDQNGNLKYKNGSTYTYCGPTALSIALGQDINDSIALYGNKPYSPGHTGTILRKEGWTPHYPITKVFVGQLDSTNKHIVVECLALWFIGGDGHITNLINGTEHGTISSEWWYVQRYWTKQ